MQQQQNYQTSKQTKHRVLTVNIPEKNYPIIIGQPILQDADSLQALMDEFCLGKQVAIVSNKTIAPIYLQHLEEVLRPNHQVITCLLEDGERYKSAESLQLIYDQLIKAQFNRKCTLIALGGGVVGDITGFAAATWLRGVNCLQIPTTLLAQVDSSVGGKTGINHLQAKNMIGAFHQPVLVIADTMTLKTLPDRQFRSGLAEVIKYGLLWDYDFFIWLEQNIIQLQQRDTDILSEAIYRSCAIKAQVVAQDERESNIRALLNFGHTFGHAIEAHQGYTDWLHGEAIAAGMMMAAELSQLNGSLNQQQIQRISKIFTEVGLPTQGAKNMQVEDYQQRMQSDKKNQDQGLPLILLEDIGKAVVSNDYQPQHLLQVLQKHAS